MPWELVVGGGALAKNSAPSGVRRTGPSPKELGCAIRFVGEGGRDDSVEVGVLVWSMRK